MAAFSLDNYINSTLARQIYNCILLSVYYIKSQSGYGITDARFHIHSRWSEIRKTLVQQNIFKGEAFL